MELAALYHLLTLSTLLALLGILVVNLRVLPRLSSYRGRAQAQARVAVLVPARNEQANIEGCLRSLLAQDYAHLEVWLYDDLSTDATGEIAKRVAREDDRLRVITGESDPPPGWLGKANACHRLYSVVKKEADPDYLVFTDADVRFAPDAISQAVAAIASLNAGLLSVFPMQVTGTWAERLAVPLLQHWAVYTFLPLPIALLRNSGPAFAAANGQFMLFTREAYEAAGGHGAVRSDILEDVALSRAVKRAGYRAVLADGGSSIITRMYTGGGEVWRGYSKNAYAFFGFSPSFLALGVVVLAALYVAPPLLALSFLPTDTTGPYFYAALAEYGAAVAARLLLALRFGYRAVDAFLHPLGVLYLLAILLNSALWAHSGRGDWKGRAAARRG